jgi:alpha-mannosidase
VKRAVARRLLPLFGWFLLLTGPATAHDVTKVFLADDNHTDYGWNDTTTAYDQAMLAEIDYFLARIGATAGSPAAEQARFNADCWWYLRLYEQNRSAVAFQQLVEAIRSGHVTVPLNPFVELYGALPTEAAIRAGYYPGRIERRFGVPFLTAQEMENATIPWGVASLWAGSRTRYSWKGLCGDCGGYTLAPFRDQTTEVFRWQGPDDKELLMKWYQLMGDNTSYGGYAEAREHLSAAGIQQAVDYFSTRPPEIPIVGLFGYGWDDVGPVTPDFEGVVRNWNDAHPGVQAVVSNEIDYFQALEPSRDALPRLRGGWGNDWDLWPTALAAESAQIRGAVERLRGAEALVAAIHLGDASVWQSHRDPLEAGLIDAFKYFEHTWGSAGLVPLSSVEANKVAWAASVDDRVRELEGDARTAFAAAFTTPSEDRFAVMNPLGFTRTDVADLAIGSAGPFVVTDVDTGAEVPSQVVTRDGATSLRILARDVPSLGYRVYRYTPGTPAALPAAAAVNDSTITGDHYQATLGARGDILSLTDLAAGGRELAGPVLNDFGSGTGTPVAENVGPVSATLVTDVTGPPARRVRVTLLREVDRVEIEDEILENDTDNRSYRFSASFASPPAIHFEEVGAIAQPGLAAQGGDFLPGTRADFMTLNHFVDLSADGYAVTLSNADAFAMKIGNSDLTSFDLPSATVNVLALGNPSHSAIADQGGATHFRNRFALRGAPGAYSGAAAMRMSLAHQNPLLAVALPRNGGGRFTAPTASLVSIDAPNVVATAFKPAEEGNRGLVLRVWELEGRATDFTIAAAPLGLCRAYETSLVETDLGPVGVDAGSVHTSIAANEIKTYRLTPDCTIPPDGGGTLEQCGDCVDNDGDGLVDHEDPDCCTATAPLAVRSALLRPARNGRSRGVLKLKAVSVPGQAFDFDPLGADTSLQIADGSGELFCATIPAANWKGHGRQNFVFADKRDAFASGLAAGRLRRKNGAFTFTARGGRLALRPVDGQALVFTLRSGGSCARSLVNLRRRKSAVVFP